MQEPKVTRPTTLPLYAPDLAAYADAVATLFDLVDETPDTGGARAAAEVLLSCYNGSEFQLAPYAIRTLSSSAHRAAAFTVIVQSTLRSEEPHQVVPDGNRRFRALWDKYADDLHVRNRYQSYYKR
jgi:hypothetical protein